MTSDQFAILQHQISAGRRYSGMDTDLSRHNEKLAQGLTTALVERAELLEALKGVVAVADRSTVEFDAARAAIAKAEGRA